MNRRLVQSIVLLFIISAVVFSLLHAVPGGPLAIYLENPNVRPQDIERLKHSLGLDRSLVAQYLTLRALLHRERVVFYS